MKNLNSAHYEDELKTLLASPVLRIFFWRLIVEDCRVFQAEFPTNAAAYTLLARQEIGKRLLADAKRISPDLVYQAEREYEEFMEKAKPETGEVFP